MPDTKRFFKRRSFTLSKDRRLSADGSTPPPSGPEPPDIEDVLKDEVRQVRDKALELENAIKSAIGTRSVPVEEGARRVRAAVARTDPPSGGAFITLPVYERALSSRETLSRLSPEEVASTFDIHDASGSDKLSDLLLAKQADMSKEDAEYVNSQSSYLLVLQLMQRGMQALETQKQTSGKFPPGVEAVPTLASLLASIAFQIRYATNTAEQIKRTWENLSGDDVDIEKAIIEAQKIESLEDPQADLVIQSKKPADAELIVDYAHTYISGTVQLGYEPWVLLSETRHIRLDLDQDLNILDRYKGDAGSLGSGRLHLDLGRLMRQRTHTYSDAIDRMASSLSFNEVDIETICSLNWLLNVPKAILLLMESIYGAYLAVKSLQLKAQFDVDFSPKSFIWHLLHDVIALLIAATKNLLCWFQRDPEMWDIIYRCPPVAEMADMIITAIEEIERWVLNRFNEAFEFSRALEVRVNAKAKIGLEIKRIRLVLRRLQYVFKAAKNLEGSIEQFDNIVNSSEEVFGEAIRDLGVTIKEKPDRLRDFARKKFDSDFLKGELEQGRIPNVMPFVPADCPLNSTDPDFSRLEKKVEEALILRRLEGLGEGAANVARRFGALAQDVVDEFPEGSGPNIAD